MELVTVLHQCSCNHCPTSSAGSGNRQLLGLCGRVPATFCRGGYELHKQGTVLLVSHRRISSKV
jgi:hypothetical protein